MSERRGWTCGLIGRPCMTLRVRAIQPRSPRVRHRPRRGHNASDSHCRMRLPAVGNLHRVSDHPTVYSAASMRALTSPRHSSQGRHECDAVPGAATTRATVTVVCDSLQSGTYTG